MTKARDIAALDAKGTNHSALRAAELRTALANVEAQAEAARSDSSTARGDVLRLRAERDKHLLDAVGNAKAAAEAAVALELSRIKALEAAARLRASRAIAEKVCVCVCVCVCGFVCLHCINMHV